MKREALERLQRRQLWAPGVGASERCFKTDGKYRCRLVRHHESSMNATPHLFCKTYDELIEDTKRQISEIEQYFVDVASWNENSVARLYEGAAPVEPDPDGQMTKMLDGLRAMLARERVIGRLKD